MKNSCDIIRDILPLYAEDMVSTATKEMVDEHLTECEGCTAELETLRKSQKLPVEVDVKSLKRVGDSIRRRRILAVMAVFLLIATILVGGALMLDATIYLSAGEAVEDIWAEGDFVKIRWDDHITGTSGSVDKENPGNYAVTAWTNLYNYLFPKERIPYDQLGDEVKEIISKEQYEYMDNISAYSLGENVEKTNFIYVDPSQSSMTLILNADQPFPDAPLMNVDPYTAYYVYGLAGVCILACLMGMYFRNKWFGELFWRLSILLGSLALSAVIVTAGHFSGLEGHFHEALVDSSAVALPMCLFGLYVRQIIRLNRQDKGL